MKKLALLFVLAFATVSVRAQTAPTSPAPTLKALIEANRATITTLLTQQKDLIEQLKKATPQEKETIQDQLQQLVKETRDSRRDIAKAIRQAMKERRLQAPRG